MRILFLTRFFYPHIGGVEKHVLEISKQLVKLGYEVVVISEETVDSSTSGECMHTLPRCLRAYQIPVGKDDWFKKFRIWGWLFKNRALIKEADIVHAHDVAFWYFPFRPLYHKKPFFITFHGYEQYPPTKKQILIRKISEKIAWGNICVGDYISKWYGMKADYVTYGAVNISSRGSHGFTPLSGVHPATIRGDLGVSLPLIFIGRLDEQTGIMTYLEVFKKYQLLNTNCQLLILGDGPLRGEMEKFIKENKLKAKTLGFVAKPEKYLQDSRFAFVSRYLSILEAMVAKKLIFAAYNNPLKEDYLKQAPFSKWTIISRDPEDMYIKLIYYTQHPQEEEKIVEEAYHWVREQTWEKVVDIYLKL